MKTTVVLCFLLIFYKAYANTSKFSEDVFTPTEKLCLEELKLNPRQIAHLNNKNYVPDGNLKYASFIGCFWEKLGWQDSTGKIDYIKIKKDVEEIYNEEEGDSSSQDSSSSEELNSEERRFEFKVIITAIEKCQYNPPAEGITAGQTALRVRNCIASALENMENKGQY